MLPMRVSVRETEEPPCWNDVALILMFEAFYSTNVFNVVGIVGV